jgi:hypothetical protein
MQTVEELKNATARLPGDQQVEIWRWLNSLQSVKRFHQDHFRAEVAAGVESLSRRDFLELKDEAGLRDYFATTKQRVRERLRNQPAADE